MTDIEHAADHAKHPDSTPSPGMLELAHDHPQTVYIATATVSGKLVAVFSLKGGPGYYGGIQWTYDGEEFAMFITFVLTGTVIGVDCDDLWYSPPYTDDGIPLQNMCVIPGRATFDFTVLTSDNVLIAIDPKIVVTPLPST